MYYNCAVASKTRILSTGGVSGGSLTNRIESINPLTLGNSADQGDLTAARRVQGGGFNKVRGLMAGGYEPAYFNVIESVFTDSGANATDFGDLTQARLGACGVSSPVRAAWGGGATPANTPLVVEEPPVGLASEIAKSKSPKSEALPDVDIVT
jgi:hypothetical protein